MCCVIINVSLQSLLVNLNFLVCVHFTSLYLSPETLTAVLKRWTIAVWTHTAGEGFSLEQTVDMLYVVCQ